MECGKDLGRLHKEKLSREQKDKTQHSMRQESQKKLSLVSWAVNGWGRELYFQTFLSDLPHEADIVFQSTLQILMLMEFLQPIYNLVASFPNI